MILNEVFRRTKMIVFRYIPFHILDEWQLVWVNGFKIGKVILRIFASIQI